MCRVKKMKRRRKTIGMSREKAKPRSLATLLNQRRFLSSLRLYRYTHPCSRRRGGKKCIKVRQRGARGAGFSLLHARTRAEIAGIINVARETSVKPQSKPLSLRARAQDPRGPLAPASKSKLDFNPFPPRPLLYFLPDF